MIRNSPWPRDVGVGAVSGLLGIVFIVGATQITPDTSEFNVLGPQVAPLAIGIAVVFCSAALMVQGLHTGTGSGAATPSSRCPAGDSSVSAVEAEVEVEAEMPSRQLSARRLLVTFALFTVYILLFIPLGYLLSTFSFLLAMTTYTDPGRWVRNSLFATGFALTVFFLFSRALQVQLPPGLLG